MALELKNQASPKSISQNTVPPQNRLYFIETYGCQMNEYDTGVIASILNEAGFKAAGKMEEAGIIMLNTCAIRERAHEKIYNRLRSIENLSAKEGVLTGVLGCMAQNLGDDLLAQGLGVDFIAGPDSYRKLPGLIEDITQKQDTHRGLLALSRTETYGDIQATVCNGPLAFVTIMRGCDNFCSFCVVPYTRGRERSRSPESVIQEIQSLIENNQCKEITLLGQNVNSYQFQDFSFTELCRRILDQTPIERLRFTSPHPHDFPPELLHLMRDNDRFCSQIHLPLQSGSDAVLQRMRRDYSQAEYLDLVARIRDLIPDVGLTTDIIVGFCGETEADFEATLDVVKAVEFDMAFMFHYSERAHTGAYKKLPDDVSQATKIQRLQKLIEIQNQIASNKNKALIGRQYSVLAEKVSKRSPTHLMGRSANGKAIVFDPRLNAGQSVRDCIGHTFNIEVHGSTSATLLGAALDQTI